MSSAIPCRGATAAEQLELDRLWFATREPTQRRAAAICRKACPIIGECWTLGATEDEGVWGGTTEVDRRRLGREDAA